MNYVGLLDYARVWQFFLDFLVNTHNWNSDYFGRKSLAKKIVATLGRQQFAAVCGARRSGKTFILKAIEEYLADSSGRLAVYVSLKECKSEVDFWLAISEEILKKDEVLAGKNHYDLLDIVSEFEVLFKKSASRRLVISDRMRFVKCLRSLLNSKALGSSKFVILDDLDVFIDGSISYIGEPDTDILIGEILRALKSMRSARFVIADGMVLMDSDEWIYNLERSVKITSFYSLNKIDSEFYVSALTGIFSDIGQKVKNEIVSHVALSFGDLNPFQITTLCQYLSLYRNRTTGFLSFKDVNNVRGVILREDTLNLAHIYEYLKMQFRGADRDLAEGVLDYLVAGSSRSSNNIHAGIGSQVEITVFEKILERLRFIGVLSLSPDEGVWNFKSGIFRDWWSQFRKDFREPKSIEAGLLEKFVSDSVSEGQSGFFEKFGSANSFVVDKFGINLVGIRADLCTKYVQNKCVQFGFILEIGAADLRSSLKSNNYFSYVHDKIVSSGFSFTLNIDSENDISDLVDSLVLQENVYLEAEVEARSRVDADDLENIRIVCIFESGIVSTLMLDLSLSNTSDLQRIRIETDDISEFIDPSLESENQSNYASCGILFLVRL